VGEEVKVNIGVEVEINKVILKKVIHISLDLLHTRAQGEVSLDGEEIKKEGKEEEGEEGMLKKLLKRHL
jgi:hypothetical protein